MQAIPDAISGFSARFYAFATKRSSFIRSLHSLVTEEVLGKIGAGTVLDVGTGPGYLPIKIASENRSVKVVGLDVSHDMIRIARGNVEKASLGNVGLIVGSVQDTCLSGESVDLAVATMSFHHWADPVGGLVELHRVLKHKGELWIYELNGRPTPQSEAWMKENYGLIIRLAVKAARLHSSITEEYAERVLRGPENRFDQCTVGRPKPPLIKMTLIKNHRHD